MPQSTQRMKSTGNSKSVGKYKRHFSHFKFCKENMWLFKAKVLAVVY